MPSYLEVRAVDNSHAFQRTQMSPSVILCDLLTKYYLLTGHPEYHKEHPVALFLGDESLASGHPDAACSWLSYHFPEGN